jgi:hypothetical protein
MILNNKLLVGIWLGQMGLDPFHIFCPSQAWASMTLLDGLLESDIGMGCLLQGMVLLEFSNQNW